VKGREELNGCKNKKGEEEKNKKGKGNGGVEMSGWIEQ